MYSLPEGRRRRTAVSHLNGPSTPFTPPRSSPQPTPPSLSERPPFDWQAARENRPIYVTPSRLGQASTGSVPRRRVPPIYRRQSFLERSQNLLEVPSQWWEDVTSFPSRVLPESRLLGYGIGGFLNLLHVLVWAKSTSSGTDDWESESNGWGLAFVSLVLLLFSVLNVVLLFYSRKVYQLYLARDPVASENASFVATDLAADVNLQESAKSTISSKLIGSLRAAWRTLLGVPAPVSEQENLSHVQQLSIWNPRDGQLALLVVYSPAHAILYCTNPFAWTNCFLIVAISSLLYLVMDAYESLLKDRSILSSEVLHEYDEKFVYPMINPVKKDQCVQTHQAEIVDIWS